MLSQNTICISSSSKWRVFNIIRTVWGLKLELKGHVKEDVEKGLKGCEPGLMAFFVFLVPKRFNHNFEINILFKIVNTSNNYLWEWQNPSEPWKEMSKTINWFCWGYLVYTFLEYWKTCQTESKDTKCAKLIKRCACNIIIIIIYL